MPASTVLYERLENGIALLTLNRPDRLNSLTTDMQVEYFNQLDRAVHDPDVKVIVVTGNGRGFCAGAEMNQLETIESDDNVFATKRPSRSTLQSQTALCPKPVIAAINGPCAGLGFVLATMADIRFTIKKAKFTTAFAKRGLAAEYGISYTLPKIVGTSTAMDLLLSSRVFLGDEAKELGFVSKAFDTKEELLKYTLEYAENMAKFCSPASLAVMKRQIYEDSNKDLVTAEAHALQLIEQTFEHPDSKEGIQSYIQKRDPIFQGLRAGTIHQLLERSKL